MGNLEQHRILVLGWPVNPRQEWLKNYPFVTADRIYQEGLPRQQKRWMNASFHAPKWLQCIRKLNPSYWYGNWRDYVAEYDTVIIIDELRGRDIFEYILEYNPKCRICVFYDSPIKPDSKRDPSRYRDLPIHFYTCDRKIAADYGIEFSPYFYIFSPYDFTEYEKIENMTTDTDIFFLGEEKGDRLEVLDRLRNLFDEVGVKHDLRLVRKRHGRRYSKVEVKKTTEYMSYSQYVEHAKKSKVILELVSNGQTGITQRPYEALFLRKKLITSSDEVKKYDFYCPENVFVMNIGELPSETEIRRFIQQPMVLMEESIRKKYDFRAWLLRLVD